MLSSKQQIIDDHPHIIPNVRAKISNECQMLEYQTVPFELWISFGIWTLSFELGVKAS
jgi:hypothetical protein